MVLPSLYLTIIRGVSQKKYQTLVQDAVHLLLFGWNDNCLPLSK